MRTLSSSHPAIPSGTPMLFAKRLLPILALMGGLAAFFALGLDRYVTLDALREHRAGLDAYVAAHAILAGGFFVLAYAAATALSIPGALFLTVAGGLLFGSVAGT